LVGEVEHRYQYFCVSFSFQACYFPSFFSTFWEWLWVYVCSGFLHVWIFFYSLFFGA